MKGSGQSTDAASSLESETIGLGLGRRFLSPIAALFRMHKPFHLQAEGVCARVTEVYQSKGYGHAAAWGMCWNLRQHYRVFVVATPHGGN